MAWGHPLYAELRAHRETLGQLIDRLALPVEEEQAGMSPAARRAQNAAAARWRKRDAHSEQRKRDAHSEQRERARLRMFEGGAGGSA